MDKRILHNIKLAEPKFLYFIKNMDIELSQWFQYKGIDIKGSHIYFKFKNSQNSLQFEVFAGILVNDIDILLREKTTEIYEYFKKLKYDNI